MDLLKLFIEAFRQMHQIVQIVLGLCLLLTMGGLITLFILVAINPAALGGVVGLITALTSTIAFLRRKGSSSPPPPAMEH